MTLRLCIVVGALGLFLAPAIAADPGSGALAIHEEAWDGVGVEPGKQLADARAAFFAMDIPTSAGQLRKTAKHLREAAANAMDETRDDLHAAAESLENLAKRMEARTVESVHEVDRILALAFHAIAQQQFAAGEQSWRDRRPQQAGLRLRAAADNLERAAAAAGHRASQTTEDVIKESRTVSGNLVRGTGYAVDEVGKVFVNLGKQVEHVGDSIELGVARRAPPIVIPR